MISVVNMTKQSYLSKFYIFINFFIFNNKFKAFFNLSFIISEFLLGHYEKYL